MIKNTIYTLILLFSILGNSQNKAIIIKNKYEFQKEANSYNINNMLKGILISAGYEVYFEEDNLPLELAQNRCNAYVGNLIDKSNMFNTKIQFQLKDCQNKIVFETVEYKSKEKDIQAGYIEVIKLISPEIKQKSISVKSNLVNVEKQESQVEIKQMTQTSNSLSKIQLIPTPTGYTIIDETPKVLLNVFKTSNSEVFIADKFGKKGVFYKKENKWIFEYYENDKLISEEFVF